jgi:hypothetical protein
MTELPSTKIEPRFEAGDFVKVAGAANQAEAEFVQALLLEEDVPSTLRRSRGSDVPEFLAAGPRDVLVPASAVPVARDVLLQANLGPLLPAPGAVDPPVRVLAGVFGAVVLGAVAVWVGIELLG